MTGMDDPVLKEFLTKRFDKLDKELKNLKENCIKTINTEILILKTGQKELKKEFKELKTLILEKLK